MQKKKKKIKTRLADYINLNKKCMFVVCPIVIGSINDGNLLFSCFDLIRISTGSYEVV